MRYSLGVDIGGMSVKYSFVDEKGRLFKKEVYHFPVTDQEGQIEDLANHLKGYLYSNIPSIDGDFCGIGIGCPGAINSITGNVDSSPNLKWSYAPLKKVVSDITGYRVITENDANAATLGEARFGAGQGYQNVIMITIGTGIGGGILINGKLYSGNEGKGAEIGHMIIAHGGNLCGCGLHGCFEAYASASALIKATKAKMTISKDSKMWEFSPTLELVDGRTAFEAAKKGDKAAQEVVDEYISYFGDGLINICNIFRPEAILFSGGVSNQKDALIAPLKAYLEKYHYGYIGTPAPELKIASLGDLTGIYGAAALMFD